MRTSTAGWLACGLWLSLNAAAIAGDPSALMSSDVAREEESSCDQDTSVLVAQSGQPSEPEPPGDVKERAIPRMAPGMAPITRLQGGAIQGNRLLADPGYVLESLPGNRLMLRPNGGGGGVQVNCRCVKTGGCSLEVDGSAAFCRPSANKGCTTSCIMTVGGKFSGQMSIQ